jgi:TRAP-type C4-dicarboxylate transport system permease small subunit
MKKILSNLQKIEDSILIVTFVVMVLSSFAQVVNRNITHSGISWFEELSRYCMVYMALLAAEAGLRDGTQISITAITDMFNDKTRKFILIIAKIVVLVFAVVVFVTSFELIRIQLASGQSSPGLKLPMVVPYMALPISFGIIVIVQAGILIKMVMEAFSRKGISGEVK